MQVACNAACVQGKHSCKREGELCVCESNQAWAWVCAYASVIISQIASGQLVVYVCVMEMLLKVLLEARPEMCVCVYIRSRVGMNLCMCLIITLPSTVTCVYVCICMLTPLDNCDYIRQLVHC